MQIKVLVVDDSRFYRNRLCELLANEQDIQVIATAQNGREAVEKVRDLKPDVVTMDIEMPVLDGISAVREIMKIRPIPILMFSSLTAEGAKATLDALDAGAVDFMLKRLEDMAHTQREFAQEICNKIRAVAKSTGLIRQKFGFHQPNYAEGEEAKPLPRPLIPEKISLGHYRVVVIGASTGGPSAIQEILTLLPPNYPVPVLVVQHMPAAFTGPFARRLDSMCKLSVKEAEDGDILENGHVYIAPGGKQTLVVESGGRKIIRVRESKTSEQYKPSVDVCFESVSNTYGKYSLAIVLTGMGSDGRNGATQLKENGSSIWVQDEQSCVVYGMPQAVAQAGLADRIMPVTEIARQLAVGV